MASHRGTGAKIRQGYLIRQNIPQSGRLLGVGESLGRILALCSGDNSVEELSTKRSGTAESWDTHRNRDVQRAGMHVSRSPGHGTPHESTHLFRVIVAVAMMVMIVMRFPRMGIIDT